MLMTEWTKKLNVGDKVIVRSNHGLPRISTVDDITPEGFIKVDGMLFCEYGFQRTTSWYKCRIEEYTEEKAEQIRQQNTIDMAVDLMRNCNKSHIDYQMAVQIIEILYPNGENE